MTDAKSPWLFHIHGVSGDKTRLFEEAAGTLVSEVHSGLAKTLKDNYGDQLADGYENAAAANHIVLAGLDLQRKYSPQGYVAMITALMEGEPLLGDLRAGLAKAYRRKYWARVLLATFTGIAIGVASTVIALSLVLRIGYIS